MIKRQIYLVWFILCCTLLPSDMLLARTPPTGAAATWTSATEDAGAGSVEFLRNISGLTGLAEDADHFTIGGGFLYWAKCQPTGPNVQAATDAAGTTGYLRRWPIRGGLPRTLSAAAFCETDHWVADAEGLYYWQNDALYRRSAANPFAPEIITTSARPSSQLVVDGHLLYWATGTSLWQVPKAQTWVEGGRDEAEYMAETGAIFSNLIVSGSRLYWSADGQIRSIDKSCVVQCTVNLLASEPGFHLSSAYATGPTAGTETSPHWVSGPYDFFQSHRYTGRDIRGYRCTSSGLGRNCAGATLYTTPDRSDASGTVRAPTLGPLTDDGRFLFWIENLKICSDSPLGRICNVSEEGRLMKWKLQRTFLNNDPFLTPQPIASRNSSGAFSIRDTGEVQIADGWVYFITSNGLSRIRADAPPLQWDIAFSAMEVTQGIQNLANQTPLVANKPTAVRVYHRKLSGANIYGVNARLYGTHNDTPLPGSPLRAANGGLAINKLDANPNRMSLQDSWIFQLPDSWTNAGAILLNAQIDPRGEVNDPVRGNNSSGGLVYTFTSKAPICLVTVPVRTHAPAARNDDPSLFRMADMMRQLIPARDIWIFHQDNDVAQIEARFGIPPWKYEPYALPRKGENILNSLQERDLFSDDPDVCDDAGAITHYVGLVHADTPTTEGDTETFGLGRRVSPLPPTVSWIKLMHPWQFVGPDRANQRVNVLVHELTHNYGRQHINCGSPANIDNAYPYVDAMNTNCTLDDGLRGGSPIPDHQRYVGFDLTTSQPISPDGTADFISYGSPYWVSDYTWKALFGRLNATRVLAPSVQAAQAGLSTADGVIYAFGTVDPTQNQATLESLWNIPSTAMSQGMLRKASYRAAAAYSVQSAVQEANYHLRLLDAGGLPLADRVVTLAERHAPSAAGPSTFGLTFPAPVDAVVRIELLDGETVLAAVDAGSSTPTVSIVSPTGGETIEDALTITWRASDADTGDRLTFNVQYSPDSGQHWRALLTNVPGQRADGLTSVVLTDLSDLTTANGSGLIRVLASDGYHTTTATSNAFSVTNRAPKAYIVSPNDQPIAAGDIVIARGGATDPEDGGLSGEQLRWTLNGTALGSGSANMLEGLAPGDHALTLTAVDNSGSETSVNRNFTVAPLVIAQSVTAPVVDGVCNDDGYASAVQVPLAPYSDGEQATVYLVGSGDALYACFVGMARTHGSSPGTLAGLRVDSDNSRDGAPGANDFAFYLDEGGVVTSFVGNGNGFVAASGGALGQVSATEQIWHGELRVDSSILGGWNHVVRLGLSQVWVDSSEDIHFWPHSATVGEPGSWGRTVLGALPLIEQVTPAAAAVGSADVTVTIDGSGFADSAQATWNGEVRSTTVISTTRIQVQIPATDLAASGTYRLGVQNYGDKAGGASPAYFLVHNPAPAIFSARLSGTQLTVNGADFVTGSVILWNGRALTPSTATVTQLQVILGDEQIEEREFAEIGVHNPGPGGGVSSVIPLQIEQMSSAIYLPLVRK